MFESEEKEREMGQNIRRDDGLSMAIPHWMRPISSEVMIDKIVYNDKTEKKWTKYIHLCNFRSSTKPNRKELRKNTLSATVKKKIKKSLKHNKLQFMLKGTTKWVAFTTDKMDQHLLNAKSNCQYNINISGGKYPSGYWQMKDFQTETGGKHSIGNQH